jgi:hypothetical protein
MKKLIFTSILLSAISVAFGQNTADLNGVTFGFGAGPSHTFDKIYDYSLTPDASHNLKIQRLNKNAFVISSVIMVKLGKIAVDQDSNKIVKQSYTYQKARYSQHLRNVDSNKRISSITKRAYATLGEDTMNTKTLKKEVEKSAKLSFWDHVSVNLALNLVNVAPDVSFNKNIDGGIGFGYFITENLQAAVFYDVSRVSQLRDYIVTAYQDKPIPNADGTNYNALDAKDTNLFYNKTISGLSFKLVFSLANKKPPQTPPAK